MSAPHPVHSTAQPADPSAAVPASGAPTTAAPAAAAAGGAEQPKKAPKEKKAKKGDITSGMAALELNPPPEYLASRIELFEQLKKEADEKVAAMPRQPIKITLPDGSVKEGTSYETSPFSIALGISKSLVEKTVIAKVNGELWDLERPFEGDASLELLDFEHPEGKKVWWHSSAHILGECCERHYGCHLAIGPPTDEGFFYEMGMNGDRVVAQTDYESLETLAKSVVKDKQKFERLEVSKENLLKMFAYNPFKTHIINDKIPDGTSTTVYRCGPMIDLCRGPHIPHTGRVKSLAVLKNSSSYFLGDANNESLQRIYGISFPDTNQMKEYKKFLEEAAKRDHRRIGKDQELFFFHEMGMNGDRVVAQTDYESLETLAKSVVKDKQKFERLEVSKENLLKMFAYNPFKTHIINDKIPDGTSTTVYRCGPMIDLCRGPHIPHTGRVKSLAVLKNSSSYFLGDANNESLQRIYGISFPDTNQMKEYKKFLEEAAKRDHRRIGKDQELFFFHEMSPGSAFWLPHGTRIYNTLIEFMRAEYRKRNYQEVITPNMFNSKLWETSGHWQNYADDMFKLDVEKEQFALKPMNCPSHCLIFASRDRSYRELPIRMADFGVLHRNEASGALTGLTRVRRFQQDDAHHFCMPEQIEEEMDVCFEFLNEIYGTFGFTFDLKLSTRPEKYLGKLETWDEAEKMLAKSLDKFVPGKWVVDEGDGAFYGPKIDITIQDALKRKHQCATIQLDFQLPQRFELSYRSAEGGDASGDKLVRPVMIHRAILGSVERFTAILTEHFAGKWPFWLSPRQVVVIPVAAPHKDYAKEVAQKLWDAGIYADADLSDATLPKKVRNGEIAQYNFIFVVGSEEAESRSVNVRNRDDAGNKKARAETIGLDDVLSKLLHLKETRSLSNQFQQ